MENNNTQDFEQMKEQINLLKNKLNNNSSINEYLFKKAINNNRSKIDRTMKQFLYLGICTLLLAPPIFYKLLGASIGFILFIVIGLMCAIIAQIYSIHMLPNSENINNNVLTYDKTIYKFINYCKYRYIIGLIYIIILGVWTAFEFNKFEFLFPMIIGGSIGFIMGTYTTISIIKAAKEIREDIADLECMKNSTL